MSQKLAKKDINLLDVYQVKKEPSKYASILKYLSVPLVAAILFGSIFGFNQYRISQFNKDSKNAQKEIDALNEQAANDPNLETYNKYLEALNEYEKLVLLDTDIKSYPQLSQNTFDQIVIASDINVSVISFSYVRESQVITLTIESPYANDTENFVRRLKTSGTFASVDYSGYSMVERTTETVTDNSTNSSNNSGSSSDSSSSTDETKKLLEELLNIKNNNNSSQTTEKTTTTVYTATVLCVLK